MSKLLNTVHWKEKKKKKKKKGNKRKLNHIVFSAGIT